MVDIRNNTNYLTLWLMIVNDERVSNKMKAISD